MDGTVVLDGLAGGRCLAVEYIPDGWILQSITVGGQDVTNVPLVFEPGQEITDVVFRVTPGDRLRAAPRNCKN